MDYTIFITVDENDGDYRHSISTINEDEANEIKQLLERVINCKHAHNFPVGEQLRDDLGEKSPYELYGADMEETINKFIDLCPYCEFGFHSIISVQLVPSKEVIEIF